jgi:hypothetical protein
MNVVAEIVRSLDIGDTWVDTSGVTWFATGNLDPRQLAQFLGRIGARLITITAYELPGDGGYCLEYLWDFDGQMLGFPFHPPAATMPGIVDLCEAADWIEREIHEEFAITFSGREYEPLLLRQGDKPGVNLREMPK